ncbi:MAG: biopolymer transporter ExbD [Candidatus Omnitrophota bacterium]|nr:biopolymer transporter ExbD [Candidatus Omnitrophota bacterium]
MKICGKRDYLVNLESVAMTDIVLNMFIFFFISFSLLYTFSPQRLQKLRVNVPEAKNTKAIEDTKLVNISVTKDGIIYLENDPVTIGELKDEIIAMRKSNPNIRALLSADKLTQFKEVARVLDTLSDLAVKSVSIAVIPEK